MQSTFSWSLLSRASLNLLQWCSWNAYHRNFNESVFYNTVTGMKASGLQNAGYGGFRAAACYSGTLVKPVTIAVPFAVASNATTRH